MLDTNLAGKPELVLTDGTQPLATLGDDAKTLARRCDVDNQDAEFGKATLERFVKSFRILDIINVKGKETAGDGIFVGTTLAAIAGLPTCSWQAAFLLLVASCYLVGKLLELRRLDNLIENRK